MNKVKIVSAITSKDGVTLYTEEGREINLPATGWRTKSIMDEIMRPLAKRKVVEIDLDNYSIEAKVEARTGGFVRFIKRKFKDFASHFNLRGEEPKEEHRDYTAPSVDPEAETTVAVVNGVEIPGMEKLEKQIEYAAFQSAKGLQKFLERISAVSDKRGHTVQELLNFMEKGDLPIADDGTIVAYKILRYRDEKAGVFVDCHSRKVTQKVGSRVSMDEKLVDPSRSRECSTGLHVARRGYINGFGGDLVTLIKVAPEDVIAVPYREPDKMRAAAYHVVAKLPTEAYRLLMSNKPMTTHEASAKILANVIAGDHIGITEDVVIGGPKGTDLKITSRVELVGDTKIAEAKKDVKPIAALDDRKEVDESVSVKAVKQVVEEVVAEKKAEKEMRAAAKASKQTVKREKVASRKGGVNKKPSKVKKRPAAPAAMTKPVTKEIPEKWREAYQRVKSGEISQREAEKIYSISAKKLRALRREIEGK